VFEERYRDRLPGVPVQSPSEIRVRRIPFRRGHPDAPSVVALRRSDRDRDGKPTGWADQHPVAPQRADERIFLGRRRPGPDIAAVRPLSEERSHGQPQGQCRIAARAAGVEPPVQLPESVCHVYSDFEPMKLVRIDNRYRVRGDGLIEQTTRQFHDANPRDEDLAWAIASFEELLAFRR
jgi:hypothetical protein